MDKKTILITGVAGLLGSNLADFIVKEHPEYEVIGIDNLFGGYVENVNSKVIFYKRDLAVDDISDIFENVVHLIIILVPDGYTILVSIGSNLTFCIILE